MCGAVLAALMSTLAAAPAASAAVAGTSLPLSGFGHLLVDGTHHHLFITGGPADSTILVRKEDGTAAGSISGESGAGGMVLDGSTLYVARCGQGVIDVIDTATLTKTDSIPAAVDTDCDLAEAGGLLWYSDSTDGQWGHLWSVSLDASHTAVDSGRSYYQAIFATTPVQPDWLLAGDRDSSDKVDVLDVSDPSAPTVVASAWNVGGPDLAISPDGSTLYAVGDGATASDLPNLTPAGSYPAGTYPTAVAISPSGGRLATGANGIYWPDVWEYDTGNSTATARWDFGPTSDTTLPGGLAYSEDGRRLFVVTDRTHPKLRVLPGMPLGKLSVSRSRTSVLYGKAVTITAHLATATTSRAVKIYRQPVRGGSPVLVASGTVGASGNLSVSVKPSVDTRYWAVWDGDASHSQTTSPDKQVGVHVQIHSPAKGGYASRGGYRLYHYTKRCSGASHSGCPRFLAYASPLHPGRTLSFTVQAKIHGSWRTVLKGSHGGGSSGRLLLTIYYTSPGVIGLHQRIRFSMASDGDHLGGTGAWTAFSVTR